MIDRDRLGDDPRRLHQLFSPLITRLFNKYPVARIEQHLGTQRQRLLGTGQHDNLLHTGLNAPFTP
ncbi:hypothetical protein D3C80_1612720 [compost metagenome]